MSNLVYNGVVFGQNQEDIIVPIKYGNFTTDNVNGDNKSQVMCLEERYGGYHVYKEDRDSICSNLINSSTKTKCKSNAALQPENCESKMNLPSAHNVFYQVYAVCKQSYPENGKPTDMCISDLMTGIAKPGDVIRFRDWTFLSTTPKVTTQGDAACKSFGYTYDRIANFTPSNADRRIPPDLGKFSA